MALFLGMIVGLAIGAGLIYFLLQSKLHQQEKALKQARKALEEQERSHETRLKDTVRSLQSDYQKQLELKTAALRQQYESQPAPALAEPPVTPEPIAEELAVAEPPVVTPPTAVEPPAPIAPVEAMQPPSAVSVTTTLQPPAIASSSSVEQAIVSLGNSGSVAYIPQLTAYAYHPDSQLRGVAATAIGKITAANSNRLEAQQAIATLSKLSRDPVYSVRLAAVEALGSIPSPKVIPSLKLALRDIDLSVVRAASQALDRYKGYRQPSKLVKAKSKSAKVR